MFKRSQQHWSPEQCPEFLLQPLALTVPSAQGEEQWQDPKQHWEGSWCIPGNSLGSGTLVWWVRVVGWLVSCRKRVVQSLPSWQRFLASHGDTFGLMRHQAQHYKKPMRCSWLRHAHGKGECPQINPRTGCPELQVQGARGTDQPAEGAALFLPP